MKFNRGFFFKYNSTCFGKIGMSGKLQDIILLDIIYVSFRFAIHGVEGKPKFPARYRAVLTI